MDKSEKQPSAASIVNYNGLLMTRINIALSFIDRGLSGYQQVQGIRSILKPEFSKEINPDLNILDNFYLPKLKYYEFESKRRGSTQSYKEDSLLIKRNIEREYAHKALSIIITCLDKHGILEYNERDLIDSGVVY